MLTVVYIRKPVRFSSAMAGVSSKPLKSRQLILSTPFARFRKLCRIIGNRIVFDTGKPDGSTFSETAVQNFVITAFLNSVFSYTQHFHQPMVKNIVTSYS